MARQGGFELWGQLLPVKTVKLVDPGDDIVFEEEEEEAEEEDDDDDREIFDADAESSRNQFKRPACRTVIIKDAASQKEYEVIGRFPLIGPWWKVNVEVKQAKSKYYVKGYPSYFLQDSVDQSQKVNISLFFVKCGVPEALQTAFFNWLPKESSLSFQHLEKVLEQFKMSMLKEKLSKTAQLCEITKDFDIFHYVKNSIDGKAVLVALNFPVILEFLPKLLPRSVSSCIEYLNLSTINCEGDTLTHLNKILLEDPWKLGFSVILKRELNVYLAEAPWKFISKCIHLLQKIPNLQKNALIIYEKLQQRCRELGHTYEEQDTLTRLVSNEMPVEDAWQALGFMKDEEIVVTEREYIFLPYLHKSEKQIADSLCRLIRNMSWKLNVDAKSLLNSNVQNMKNPPVEVNGDPCKMDHAEPESNLDGQVNCDGNSSFEQQTLKKELKCKVDLYQEKAIKLICSNPVTIISGKGGCGKTTVVSCLFRCLLEAEKETRAACTDFEADQDAPEEWNTFSSSFNLTNDTYNYLNILLTAPTARAANLLFEKTKLRAYTLHQIIATYHAWRNKKKDGFFPWQFSEVNVLVVDEGSLVPVRILSRVLHLLCSEAHLAKVVILGDVRQLPSIEPGNMLADVFESLKLKGFCVELENNHRAESQLIVDNATRISQQRWPVFDEVLRISKDNIWPMPSPDKQFIFLVLEDGNSDLVPAIKALLERGPGLKDPKQSQFLSFRRKDCDIINEICCKHYSEHTTRNHKRQLQFLCGDKICSTKNAYLEDVLWKHNIPCTKYSENSSPCICNVCTRREARRLGNSDTDRRLCNGEIFFIEKKEKIKGDYLLTIRVPNGPEYTVLYSAFQRECKIRHAWAKTIHTFQGSEEDTVVFVLGNSFWQNWQHVYTAVTRGRLRVYIVAEEDKLREAIRRKCLKRKTRLQRFVKDALTRESDDLETDYPEQAEPSGNWQSPQKDVCSDASHGNINKSASDKKEFGTGLDATAGSAEKISPEGEHKRQNAFSDDCSSPSKVAMITDDNSPLGTSGFQRMTLKKHVSKQLFQS